MEKKTCTMLRIIEPAVLEEYGQLQGERVMARAHKYYHDLCLENKKAPQAVKVHTERKIFPALAVVHALMQDGRSRQEAAQFIYDTYEEKSRLPAKVLRTVLKVPGLYRTMPSVWRFMIGHTFSEKAGFACRFYELETPGVKFDMVKCPYHEICTKYGVPELTAAFCNTDVVCYAEMHPRLHWGRTKTLGTGGDCCDFDLRVQ